MQIEQYHAGLKAEWDTFVSASKNGTFLFYRDYMEYHSDRFPDASFLIRDDRGRVLALLPAHRSGDELVSHGGLTYGGFVVSDEIRVLTAISIFSATLEHLGQLGVRRLIYKSVPDIYHRAVANETLYALAMVNARLVRRDVLSVIAPAQGFSMQERRHRAVKKAARSGLRVEQQADFAEFWGHLERNLWDIYQAKPVHTLAEITLLKDRFPENIKLFCALQGHDVVAGVVIYESDTVAHVQYVANSPEGRKLGAVDLIYHWLLTEYYRAKPYFDFGNSVGEDAWGLNLGVLEFKESFGGRAVVHDFYEIDIPG